MMTKIGIRATSSACTYKSREKELEMASEGVCGTYYGTYREDYLSRRFGASYEHLYHYDRSASIYNLTYFLNHGEWLSDDVPLYAHMHFGIPVGEDVTLTKEQKKRYKGVAMKYYFEESAETLYNHCRERLETMPYSKEEILGAIRQGMEKMEKVIGSKYGSEIFLHESVVYLMLRRELYRRGVQTSQCYDGFWSDDPRLEEMCKELLPKVAREYLINLTLDDWPRD